ncbi:YceI family protein [uncultured Tenacibaculum sp.]|uniref:YceI family protein n=1 Tax=uncultured Tenacibaculum sp. TaxID=174713 RepID=UPI002634AF7E|nr:YceI family protein [uncultured Tenacibaculum sp.]
MRKIIILFVSLFSLVTSIKAQEKININIEQSTIKWIGELTFHFGGHDGYIQFKEGFFIKRGDKIVGGEFIIDMNSMTNSDIKEQEGKDSLIAHLKDPDFFDVEKFPLTSLLITKVEYSEQNTARIEAKLTLKGITKPINFRANFDFDKKEMTTRFKIDRRKWNVSYTSKVKDYAISDALGFEVSIKL